MKVLELFGGSRSIGKACDELGYEVFSSDIINFKGIDYVCDIREYDMSIVPFTPDVIWASPPCTGFSVAAIGKNWVKGEVFTPKTDSAKLGVDILNATLDIIKKYMAINPNLIFYIENPRGKMRKSPNLSEEEIEMRDGLIMTRHTVTYCQYGDERMKPTDIWTNNFTWRPLKACNNGDPCHVAAPRGSKTGTQGLKGNYERSKIPHALCMEVMCSFKKTLRDMVWSIKEYPQMSLYIDKRIGNEDDIVTEVESFNDANVEWYISDHIDESECEGYWIIMGGKDD